MKLEPEVLQQLQGLSKYLSRWDKAFLNRIHKIEELSEEDEKLLCVVLEAVLRRHEKDNYVIDIPDDHIKVFHKYYPQLPSNVQKYLDQLASHQGWSYTKAQEWMISIIQENIKNIHNSKK